uniref:Uncharacterized protein n=1 Tax=uncultured crenarchaeote TaxID=29281 RepID=H5SNR9_9CREN|nr:hypothetical protein HGMM_F52D10C35 [uncultured crenarchaeote]
MRLTILTHTYQRGFVASVPEKVLGKVQPRPHVPACAWKFRQVIHNDVKPLGAFYPEKIPNMHPEPWYIGYRPSIQIEVAPLFENIETQTLMVVDKLYERVHVGFGYDFG